MVEVLVLVSIEVKVLVLLSVEIEVLVLVSVEVEVLVVVSGLALEALAGFGRSSCDHTNLSTTKEAQKLWNQVLQAAW